MIKLKQSLAVLCMLTISLGALNIQVRAGDEGQESEATAPQAQTAEVITEEEVEAEIQSEQESEPEDEIESEPESEPEGDSESEPQSESESDQLQQKETRSVPTGYADMRVGKMTDDGFIKSDGIYAEYYYSARWQGEALSSGDTTLELGQITYCINPDIPLVGTNGDEAYGWIGSKDEIRNLTSSRITTKGVIFRMLGRILQVGGTDLKNGADLAGNAAEGTKYVATQMIIWQIVWGDMDAEFNLLGDTWKKFGWEGMKYYNTAPTGGKSVKDWYDQWVSELKNSKKIPSFSASASATAPTHQMTDGTLTLTDSNQVLQYMRFTPSDSSVTLTVSGNQLKIENPNRVDFSVTVTNTLCEGAKEPTPIVARRVSDGEKRQTTIVASATTLDDPVQGFFNIKAAPPTGDLLIQKETEQDALLKSQLSGFQFRVTCTETGYDSVHETDEAGQIRLNGLKKGTYTVEEVKKEGINENGSNFQYEIPQKQTVQVGETQGELAKVSFVNKLRRGDLTVYKVDATVPGIKLAGAALLLEKKVYYLETEAVPEGSETDEYGAYQWITVAEKVTGEGGKAVWNDLTIGEYRLTEVKAAPGYQLLAQQLQFSLPYGKEGDTFEWSHTENPVSISQEFTIADQPIYAMPSSGGWEAQLYIVGFALCAAGVILLKRKYMKLWGK